MRTVPDSEIAAPLPEFAEMRRVVSAGTDATKVGFKLEHS